jgi:asparagine synthase (glutamine-hydrolysing)
VWLLARGLREDHAGALPLPDRLRRMIQGDRINRLAQLFRGNDAEGMYRQMIRVSELQLTPASVTDSCKVPPLNDLLSDFIVRDMIGYLPGDILVKLDRATMATGLEARCPILDHRVVEFAWRLPNAAKVRHGQGKWILRQVLNRYLPRHLIDRPKQGFDVPIGAWLRGPLREWAADLLSEPRLRRQAFLDSRRVQSCWLEHLNGRRDHSRTLWAVLMLQSWLDTMVEQRTSGSADLLEPAQ